MWHAKTVPNLCGPSLFLGFTSASKGWLVGGSLWRTTSGGATRAQYLSTSKTSSTAFDVPNRSLAYAFVRGATGKHQLYRWKK